MAASNSDFAKRIAEFPDRRRDSAGQLLYKGLAGLSGSFRVADNDAPLDSSYTKVPVPTNFGRTHAIYEARCAQQVWKVGEEAPC